MTVSKVVSDAEAFSHLCGECEKIIDTRKRLPDFVFRRSFAKYFAIEYAYLYRQEYAAFLSKISNILADEAVSYMVLDPDPIDWYHQHASFGSISFERSALIETYVPTMYRDKGLWGILTGANVGVFWGSSLEWGIFADRISWEMAVIAISASVDVPTISGFRCMDASWLSDYVKSQYHAKDPSDSIALDFGKKFLANYPI